MNLIKYLMRGGSYGHYWLKQSGRFIWWDTTNIPEVEEANQDVYFGVNPSRTRKTSRQGTTYQDIEAINCLFGDFDVKDFDDNWEDLKEHIQRLKPSPTIIVSSGGGYHCYWLLEETFSLNTELKRQLAEDIQKQWVVFVGADSQVNDLPHLLRVPGTYNHKYGEPREVTVVSSSEDRIYKLTELQELLPQSGETEERKAIPRPKKPNDLSEQELVNRAVESADGMKFKKLFLGINEGYESASEADMAFCCLLAYWTGGDYFKMDRIFRASKRMRLKWEREDYRHNTLTKAIMKVDSFYVDPGGLLTAGAHDEGNAQCVWSRHRSKIAYNTAYKSTRGWMVYREGHWSEKLAQQRVEDFVVDTLNARRRAAVDAEDDQILRAAKPRASNVRNCMSLLERKVAIAIEDMDTDLDSLNVKNGVLNLKTGQLTPHSHKQLYSYCIPTEYDPEADSTFWEQWLLEVVGGRQEIAEYLQLAIGYSITGRTREEVMFYLQGPPRAGKGTFTESIIYMLGGRPIATEVDIALFMSGGYSTSSVGFSLAGLKPARFVAASESDESDWLNAKNVKRWTGRNLITAAHKYGRDFTYQPQFKIWLVSNFPPQMDADDKAAWSRLRIVKFPHSYLGREDKLLKSRMRQEPVQKGILKWAVEGSKKWYKLGSQGLYVPEEVKELTKQAQTEVDWVSAWITQEVEVTQNDEHQVPETLYYSEYKDWCRSRGVNPKSLRSLNRSLSSKGFEVNRPIYTKTGPTRGWKGIKLNGYGAGIARLNDKGG